MSRSPSLPDRPKLDLDADMSADERLDALRDHYLDIVTVHDELADQLEAARDQQTDLREEVDTLQRENELRATSRHAAACSRSPRSLRAQPRNRQSQAFR